MLLLFLACTDAPTPTPIATPVPDTDDTDGPDTDTDDTDVPDTDTDTDVDVFDCSTAPGGPWTATTLTGVPASEDFAFDGPELLSFDGALLVRSLYPPGGTTPWIATEGGPGGPASLRMLPNGDAVYHDVDTSTLYRIPPVGGIVPVVSSFGYAGGMEVHPSGLVYVVDLLGIHTIEPFAPTDDVTHSNAPWQSPNGITLTEDHDQLLVSARNGIWAIDVDASGAPASAATLWADPPSDAFELLGMGVDVCGHVYVTGSLAGGAGTALWRYEPDASAVQRMIDAPTGAWFSNLQWGSGQGSWDALTIYVTDQYGGDSYRVVEVGIPEKPR